MTERTDDRTARRPLASRTGVRLLLGLAAAALAVGGLLDRPQVPGAPDAPAAAASAAGPPALAAAPKAAPPAPPPSPPAGDAATVVGAPPPPGSSLATAPRRPPGAGIRGRLQFDQGLPSGVSVTISPDPRDPSRGPELWQPVAPEIAADGSFDAALPDGGAAVVEVRWPGGSARFEGNVRGNEQLDLVIRLGTASLEGRILDGAGRPVVGASVRDELSTGRFELLGGRTVTTDAAGAWRIEDLPAGRHHLQTTRPVGADLEGDVRWDTVTLAAGERRTLDLGVVATDAIWSGRVRRRDGGPPGGEGHLFLTVGSTHLRTRYEATGRFRIAAPPGTYQVVVEPRGPRRGFVLDLPPELRPAGASPAPADSIVLQRHVNADVILAGGAVSGRLLADGRPDDGATHVAFRPTSPGSGGPTPDAEPLLEALDGELRFAAVALPPGRYLLAGFLRGGLFDLVGPDGRPVVADVVDGGELTGLELRVAKP